MKQRRRVCSGVVVPNEEDVFRGYTNDRMIIVPTSKNLPPQQLPQLLRLDALHSVTNAHPRVGSEPHPSTNRAHDGVGVELHGVFVGRTGQREGSKPPRRVKICVCKAFVGYIGVSLAGVRLCIGVQVHAGWKTKFTDNA